MYIACLNLFTATLNYMAETTPALRILLLCVFTVVCAPLWSQSLKDHLQKGERYFLKKDYENALVHLLLALDIDPEDPMTNYRAGVSSVNQKQFQQAVDFLTKAVIANPDVNSDICYHLGVALQNEHRYAEALNNFEILRTTNKAFAAIAARKIRECIAGDSLMKGGIAAEVSILGSEINTGFSEFGPLLTPDGDLIFSSNRSENAYQIKTRVNLDDVYITRRQGTAWSAPEKIGENVNAAGNDVATAISTDGTTLLVYYEEGGGDIYASNFENGVWTKPAPLNRFVNHPQFRESWASLSADGTRLFFSSNRPGGRGGFDIYVCEKGVNDQWGRPTNLGSAVNTRGDELSPFLQADGKTLYFSSNGHPTLGDHDLFRSTLKDGRWTPAENLGPPINTSAYDGFLVVAPDGTHGFFSSNRKPGRTDSDIYAVSFSKTADQPIVSIARLPVPSAPTNRIGTPFAVLAGTAFDTDEAGPINATVTLVDNSTRKVVSRTQTDAQGRFEIEIPRSGNYGVTAEQAGYLFHSMNVDVSENNKHARLETEVRMVKGKVGSKITLKNIFFASNDASLEDASRAELENIRLLLVANPRWRIRIAGHTDNIGQPEANRALSLKRAEAVMNYLIQTGVSADRLEAIGYGPDRPIVSNDDERDGRQINRRTEIEIIK